ncbi:MAG: hypothetical protein M3072_13980 [Candidatus Dormibacteraeota bacterium]|nr:hypothetical protein [Candidatus Dormibacteraeota bacterium]
MSDPPPGRHREGEESGAGAAWTDELVWLDAFEVAIRNLLATRSHVLELSRSWDRSARLAPLSAPLLAWLGECGNDEIVKVIGVLRAGIEAEAGRLPPGRDLS